MTHSDIRSRRLANQRLVGPMFATPTDMVRWMGAVQAQELPASLWAIGQRVQGATEASVEQAVAERSILRTWPMRGTVHFVPAEDARWMVDLMAPRVISRMRSMVRQVGLDDAVFNQARDVVVRTLEGGKQLTRAAIYAELNAAGIATTHMRGGHIIGHLAMQGVICVGPRAGKHPTVALLDEYAPNPRTLAGEEAVAELVLRYVRSHGPATIHDFMWWTGLTMAETKPAINAVRSQLVEEIIDGKSYWSVEAVPPVLPDSPVIHLLPAFDEYMVSYKDRSAGLDSCLGPVGMEQILGYIVVIDGQMVGNWKRTIGRYAVTIEMALARPLSSDERTALERAAQRYGNFLGLPVVLS